ncbi:hypothetical protein PanWU01x14_116600 [Parasponia andersonii]|uniref:Uncharacterized protein n=1 Tax=Parasponia andersonii TaxID=3476 RepID=A0A2P5CWU6_PARAD|nr:hypothetical protein PanWU01x14_116600 [Parasponia andersonii]
MKRQLLGNQKSSVGAIASTERNLLSTCCFIHFCTSGVFQTSLSRSKSKSG